MNFPDDHYNVCVMDYDPEFMKLFYNNIDIEKIESMEINFDFNWNSIDSLGINNPDYKTIYIRYKDSADHYKEDDLIVLVIEDYIG